MSFMSIKKKKDNSLHAPLPSLKDVIEPLIDHGFIAFCGAGISIPQPSCSPSWWTLTEEILEAFFQAIPEDYDIPSDLLLNSSERHPEEVFETFAEILDDELYPAFKALDVGSANGNHIMIAKLAKKGILKACFTTNFDIFLERALKAEGVKYKIVLDNKEYDTVFDQIKNLSPSGMQKSKNTFYLCKLHGTIDQPNTIISVASAYKSAKGFSAPKANVFETFLSHFPCLFLGYSGWDFLHLNYRRFWKRVGPKIQKIYWNLRSKDEKTPDFQEIFGEFYSKLQFLETDLPSGFLEAVNSNKLIKIGRSTMKIFSKSAGKDQLQKIKQDRFSYFQSWVQKFPESHLIGLSITQSMIFSERYQAVVQQSKEESEDTDAITYNFTDQMTVLGQKYAQKEISLEDYQQKLMQIQIDMQLAGIRNKFKPAIKETIAQNKYPGITDNMSYLPTFISYLRSFTRFFSVEESLKKSYEFIQKYKELSSQNSEDAAIEMQIQGSLANMLHPEEKYWRPYEQQMRDLKDQLLAGKITKDDFQKEMMTITTAAQNFRMGMTIDIEKLIEKQINAVVRSSNPKKFEEQMEALVITLMRMGPLWYQRFYQRQEYLALVSAISVDKEKELSPIVLEGFDNLLREPFYAIFHHSYYNSGNNEILMEMLILALWILGTKWLDPTGLKEYQRMWDGGELPKYSSHPSIFKYLKKNCDIWQKKAFKHLSDRFVQKFCGFLVNLSEMGNDITLCEKATLKSLELSNGVVTEATSDGIPSSLAAFYERSGDPKKALSFYLICLDAIKLTVQPLWADTIIYRAAKLMNESGNPKSALNILYQYHPAYKGNAASINMPSRKLGAKFAEALAKSLGYSSVINAIQS
ncbi:hypothetical protein NEF87_000502 [Candidatus Lokiarchaeum ossiferum]|uniref:SIR2-like domain-containing protein n=1 Tax=Candidatus Lokiarchaeum ossiferum TaxID=2951803 RepID=A0ABY6HMV6_9ARCH|nr:hypothetical protein NEF87_000502 [Candidatus Lokiarchaeum sp. B-35]